MAIENYADLVVTAGAYANRNDAVAMMPMFLGLAEGKLNRSLRTKQMETTGSLTLANGTASLPADFLELRDARLPNRGALRQISYADLAGLSRGGEPIGFSVVGNEFRSGPGWSGPLSIVYYAKIPPLTQSSPTNWLLQSDPNVYLYALVEEISIWARDADAAGAARSLKDEAVMGLMSIDERTRFNMGSIVIGGATP